MIKWFPLKPIYLAFLIVLLYFNVFSFSYLLLAWFLLSLFFLVKQHSSKTIFKTGFLLSLFCCFFLFIKQNSEFQEKEALREVTEVQMMTDSLVINGDQLSFKGRFDGHTYQVFYQLKSQKEKTFFAENSQPLLLSVDGETQKATPQRNFNGFDYQAYLKTQGIYQTLHIEEIKAIKTVQARTPLAYLAMLRRRAIVMIQTNFPAPMKHYMTGLLFGYLDKAFAEMTNLYSSLGIIHLFALSGMQVGFFLRYFRQFFLRLGLCQEHLLVLQAVFSFIYAGLTGFSVSVIRSLIQALLSKWQIKGLDNFAITLMICLILMPFFLQTTGGVLSFSFAFIIGTINFENTSSLRKKLLESTSISLGILPLLIWFFSGFQPFSIILTAGFALLFDVFLLPLLSLAFLVQPMLSLAFFNPFFIMLERMITALSQILGQPLVFGRPNLIQLLLLILALVLLYDYRRKKKVALSLILGVILIFATIKHPLENEVTVLDIGQGDSLFIRDMTGKTLLIDVGGKLDFLPKERWQKKQSVSNADRTLIPYLKSRGVSRIDQLVLTHTDTDHIGDMEVIAKYFTIGEVLVSEGSLTNPQFVNRLKAMAVNVRVIKAGDTLPIMNSQLQVLYPHQLGDGKNNDSIVLYGKLLDKSFLFTGDLEKEGEEDLLKHYPDLKVDILKAGHHGSSGSSAPAFLKAISPSLALVSAGANNRYHHPNQETLERFKEENINVLRTDTNGAIRFKGINQWTVETVR
ncbi:DNA internalization-related competence protein ComEC/Rec2 [Streptococcus pacificus]|uniref:DNA internalization-related competence protein ComEC/Rec2 n=1 Tax=Streptococcus pacificus TaxID=2740577 RepID=A0ABS0ZJD7_9STRE|nr:DNA internalization-related competence protein ComEC/Rec2 [Streptococcus pacificus]MBJ8325651.1 DNA internalization-related competence protein ComEC/Rec2 [Streptococcus pacificus]